MVRNRGVEGGGKWGGGSGVYVTTEGYSCVAQGSRVR